MWIIFVSILFLAVLYLWCLKGRNHQPGLQELKKWYYAHRGLHNATKPENSMAAFRAALEAGYGIELDIHLMKDGNLAVIHDSSLKRTAGSDITIEELTTEELQYYTLMDSNEHIPLFSQVLELYQGKAPLIIELKAVNNSAELCQAVCKILDEYQGPYCVESFDPRCIHWFKKNRPDMIRGQLSENWIRTKSSMPGILKWALTNHILNFYTRPDFIAYQFRDRNTLSTKVCRQIWGITGVAWTIRTPEDFETALQENWIPIFENFIP